MNGRPLMTAQTDVGSAVSAGKSGTSLAPAGEVEQLLEKEMVPAGVPPAFVAKKSLSPTIESTARYSQTPPMVVPAWDKVPSHGLLVCHVTQPFAFWRTKLAFRLSLPCKISPLPEPLSVQMKVVAEVPTSVLVWVGENGKFAQVGVTPANAVPENEVVSALENVKLVPESEITVRFVWSKPGAVALDPVPTREMTSFAVKPHVVAHVAVAVVPLPVTPVTVTGLIEDAPPRAIALNAPVEPAPKKGVVCAKHVGTARIAAKHIATIENRNPIFIILFSPVAKFGFGVGLLPGSA